MSDIREMQAYLGSLPFDDEPVSAEALARIEAARSERGMSTAALLRQLARYRVRMRR